MLESGCGYKAQTRAVVESPDTEVITNEELLELDVDILIAAALENVITKNAGRLKAKNLAELANGPTTARSGRDPL